MPRSYTTKTALLHVISYLKHVHEIFITSCLSSPGESLTTSKSLSPRVPVAVSSQFTFADSLLSASSLDYTQLQMSGWRWRWTSSEGLLYYRNRRGYFVWLVFCTGGGGWLFVTERRITVCHKAITFKRVPIVKSPAGFHRLLTSSSSPSSALSNNNNSTPTHASLSFFLSILPGISRVWMLLVSVQTRQMQETVK